MDPEIERAIDYTQRLLNASIDVVGAARVDVGPRWARDPGIVALALLCRSISNFRAAIHLVQQEHVLEARSLVRLLYENLLWLGGLREEGSAFVQKMMDDESFNRQSLATSALRMTARHGGNMMAAFPWSFVA